MGDFSLKFIFSYLFAVYLLFWVHVILVESGGFNFYEYDFQTNSKRFLIFELISYKINHPINPHNHQTKLADKNDKNLMK